jgi:hypothetical protein
MIKDSYPPTYEFESTNEFTLQHDAIFSVVTKLLICALTHVSEGCRSSMIDVPYTQEHEFPTA